MVVSEFFTFNGERVLIELLRVAVAFVLALPIGWERSQASRRLGLRTFPIVAIASCGYMLVTKQMPDATPDSIWHQAPPLAIPPHCPSFFCIPLWRIGLYPLNCQG